MAGLAEQPVLRALAAGAARSFVIVALLIAWEWLAQSGRVTPYMLPALSDVLARIWHDATAGDLLINAGLTLYRALAGFSIAAVAGILLGAVMSRSALARWFFDPIISVGFPMPKIAFLPIVTGSMQPRKISRIFEPSPRPSHRIVTGMSADFGIG